MVRDEIRRTPFGAVLRRFRRALGLSQEALGARARMHRNYIGSLERGEKSPTLDTVARLLEVLERSWRDFGEAMEKEIGTLPPRAGRSGSNAEAEDSKPANAAVDTLIMAYHRARGRDHPL